MKTLRSFVIGVMLIVVPGAGGAVVLAALQPDVTAGPLDPRGFRMRHVVDGEPVRYDPCQPIHYVVNPRNAPPSGLSDVHTAVEMTAEATGLSFVYDGTSDEVPTPEREPYQPQRYGDRWAPVLIAWSVGPPKTGDAELDRTRPLAAAGSDYRPNDDGKLAYVSGTAVFDGTQTDINPGFGGQTWGQVILHELGHVVGLDHISNQGSVMNPVLGLRPASWGPGDRAGLWELGLGSPCLATPDTP